MSTPDGGREPQGQWSQDYSPEQAAIAQEPKNGVGTAALVLGILALISLVICWIPFVGIICVVLGLIAVILGVLGRGRAKRLEATNGGSAIAGIVLGVIALLVGIVVQILVILAFVAIVNTGGGQSFQQFQQCLSQAQNAGSPAAVQQAALQCGEQFGQQMPSVGQ